MSAPNNYAAFCRDPANTPFGPGPVNIAALTNMYHSWRTTLNAPSRTALWQSVQNHFDEFAGGIGIFVTNSAGELRLRIIHGVRKYTGEVASPSPVDNMVFGYVGDIDEAMGELVAFNTDMFLVTAETNVATVAHHKATLEAEPNLEVLPPRGDAAAQTDTVMTRMTMYVPFELLPFFLNKDLTPRDAFLVAHAQLEAKGLLEVCAPLLTFLRVAGTVPAAGTSSLVSHTKLGKPIHIPTPLMVYMRRRVIFRDFPHLDPKRGGRIDPASAALTAAVNTLASNQLKADERNELRLEETNRPKTIVDVYGDEITEQLLRLCDCEDTDLLPTVWSKLASKNKNQDMITIMQQTINSAARTIGMMEGPLVSTAVMTAVKRFNFHGLDPNDVGSGVLPMAFVPPGGASPLAKARTLEMATGASGYSHMMSTQGQSISSGDATKLAKVKGYVATDWPEAIIQLEGYRTFLIGFLGARHHVTIAYATGITYLKFVQLSLQRALEEHVGSRLAPGLLVYHFQLQVRAWFKEQWLMTEKVPAPGFHDDLKRFERSKSLDWLPWVSDVPALVLLKAATPPIQKDKVVPTGSGGGDVTRPKTLGRAVKNDGRDPRLYEDNALGTRIKRWAVLKAMGKGTLLGKTMPQRSDGKERCCTWHAKGGCFAECKKSYDHIALTPSEADSFYEWCRAVYAE